MRLQLVGGLILIILGIIALSVRSFTYFSHEQVVGRLGYFAWDVSQPHTIFINPIAGIVAVLIGAFLLFGSQRSMRT